jgi:hypothetical protein
VAKALFLTDRATVTLKGGVIAYRRFSSVYWPLIISTTQSASICRRKKARLIRTGFRKELLIITKQLVAPQYVQAVQPQMQRCLLFQEQ